VRGIVNEKVAELVRRFKAGEEAAFTELVKLYEKKVYSYARRMLGNHSDADEVLQETFIRLVRNIKRLKSDANFTSFVFRIATNLAIDLIRKRQRKTVNVEEGDLEFSGQYQLELAKAIPTPEQLQERKELMKLIRSAIDQLPPRQRTAILLHDVEGFSKEEVAGMMDCPQATVRSNLHLARHKVRKILSGHL